MLVVKTEIEASAVSSIIFVSSPMTVQEEIARQNLKMHFIAAGWIVPDFDTDDFVSGHGIGENQGLGAVTNQPILTAYPCFKISM